MILSSPLDPDSLRPFLPEASIPGVIGLLAPHDVKLRISKPRTSKLGDHRPPMVGRYSFHQISVNRDLPPYSFLITLVHEVAHLRTWEFHGRKVKAHGPEWKGLYIDLLSPFVEEGAFPDELEGAVRKHLAAPGASSCTDEKLIKALRQFEGGRDSHCFLEEVPDGSIFRLNGDRRFRKGKKLRKRFRCKSLDNGKTYLVHSMAEVEVEAPTLFGTGL